MKVAIWQVNRDFLRRASPTARCHHRADGFAEPYGTYARLSALTTPLHTTAKPVAAQAKRSRPRGFPAAARRVLIRSTAALTVLQLAVALVCYLKLKLCVKGAWVVQDVHRGHVDRRHGCPCPGPVAPQMLLRYQASEQSGTLGQELSL